MLSVFMAFIQKDEQRTLGQMVTLLEDSCHICRLRSADCIEFLAVRRLQVRSHIVGPISKVDLKILVPENLLLLAKNRVSVSRIEGRNMLKTRFGGGHKADVNRLVGVREPFEECQYQGTMKVATETTLTLFNVRHFSLRS